MSYVYLVPFSVSCPLHGLFYSHVVPFSLNYLFCPLCPCTFIHRLGLLDLGTQISFPSQVVPRYPALTRKGRQEFLATDSSMLSSTLIIHLLPYH